MERKNRLSDELQRSGYVFSVKKSVLYALGALFALVVLGRFFGLRVVPQTILCAAGLISIPFFLRNAYRHIYNQQEFSDANVYMEQFLYSFRKSGKVLDTLRDVAELFPEGRMHKRLTEAISYILHTYNETDIEKKALARIEEAYPWDGIRRMHRFALRTEELGGEYDNSIRLLLESRRMWADRIYGLQQRNNRQRRDIVLSIITSLLLCSAIYYMSGKMDIDVASAPLAQIVTVVVLLVDLYIYYRADARLTTGVLESQSVSEKDLIEVYERYRRYSDKKLIDRIGKRIAKKRLSIAVEQEFPVWLMQISLLLQTENVEVAIFRSVEDAPAILKPALTELAGELKREPGSMRAYSGFLSEFSLPEISSSMKMLYSISNGNGGDASSQIEDIIRRNNLMQDRNERQKDEDSMAGMRALFLAPQLTGGFKLIVDMALLLIVYLSEIGYA